MIRTFCEEDIKSVVELQQKNARANLGAKVVPGEAYLSPAFHGGKDVFCAFDGERLSAYAPLYLQEAGGTSQQPHTAWVEITADPDLQEADALKDVLLDRLLCRAHALAEPFQPGGLRVCFQYASTQAGAIAYVQSRGFECADTLFSMRRDLSHPVPSLPLPKGICLKNWRMETEADLEQYVAGRNECFPEAPITVDEWRYFLGAPAWREGANIAAFAEGELAGNVSVFWDAEENAETGDPAGYTEYIFVRPSFRNRGIALAMIAAGLRYLRQRGLAAARLEVRAANTGSLSLYQRLGYQVCGESRFYQRIY